MTEPVKFNALALVIAHQRATADLKAEAAEDLPSPPPASGPAYPAKRLAFENGQYRPVDHEK